MMNEVDCKRALRSKISRILFLQLAVLACDEEAPAPPPPDLAVVEATGPSELVDEVERAKVAQERLAKKKTTIKAQTVAAFWEAGEAASNQQHWKEARTAFEGLALHHPQDAKADLAIQRAALSAFRLGEYREGLEWFRDSVELVRGTPTEARILRKLGSTYLTVPHWGTKKGGEYLRGKHDQGIYTISYREDRTLAVRYLEEARERYITLTRSSTTSQDLTLERIKCQLELVSSVARFTPYDARWGYWYYAWAEGTDDGLVDEEGADERAGRHRGWGYDRLHRARPRGMPVDQEGKILFVERPRKYDRSLSVVAKIKYLLHEAEALDPTPTKDYAAEALLRQAILFRARDGAERLTRLAGWWWNGKYPYKATLESKKIHELQEDEVLGLIATHIGVYRVPDDENPLNLMRRLVEVYPKSKVVDRAQIAMAAFYQSRRQYDRALVAYRAYLSQKPDGELKGQAEHAISLIEQQEVMIESMGAQLAGEHPIVPLQHRNITKLHARARPVDVERLTSYFKSEWKKTKDYYPQIRVETPHHYLFNNEKNLERFAKGDWKIFELTVKDDGTHRYQKSEVRAPITDQGLWVIEVYKEKDYKNRLSRAAVMLESTAVVVKTTNKGALLWVVDARSGTPVSHADLEVFEYWNDYTKDGNKYIKRQRIQRKKTGADGTVLLSGKSSGHQLMIRVLGKDRFAYAGEGFYWYYSPSTLQRGDVGLIFTDRPVYRPLHQVELRAWVRRRAKGNYVDAKEVKSIFIRIYDPKGAKVFEKTKSSDPNTGGATFQYALPKNAALGLYRVDLRADGSWVSTGGNQFRVEEYKAPEFEVRVSVGEGPVKLGASVPVKIKADYYFGGGVEGEVTYKVFRTDYDQTYMAPGRWDWLYGIGYGRCYYRYAWFDWWDVVGPRPFIWYPWWGPAPEPVRELVKEGKGVLDAKGALQFSVDTKGAKERYGDSDQRFIVEAEVRDASRRTITGEGSVIATRNQFFIQVETDRGYYETGGSIGMHVATQLPTGEPTATKGQVRIAKIAFAGGNGDVVEEAPFLSKATHTDEQGRLDFTFEVKEAGQYRLSYMAKDAWGTMVEGSAVVWVWGPKFEGRKFRFNHLEVITDKRTYAVGETAKLLVSSNVADAHVLWASRVDNGALIDVEIIQLQGKTKVVTLPIDESHVPNFFVEAIVVGRGKISEEVREIFVPPPASELLVSVLPKKKTFRAGRKGSLEVRTTTPDGKAVSANVALSIHDRAVLYIQPDLTPDARKHFWGQKRTHMPRSQTNLRRKYTYWQSLNRPDQAAASTFWAAGQELEQNEIDYRRDISGGDLALAGYGRGGGGLKADRKSGEKRRQKGKLAKRESAAQATPVSTPVGSLAETDASSEDKAKDGRSSTKRLKRPEVRKRFADTAAWRVVQTNKEGRATIEWTFPDNLTSWRAKAVALTHDTRVGQGSATLVTTKKLIVRLQAPRFFRERDRVVLSANVHNHLEAKKKVKVVLDVPEELLALDGKKEQWVEVGAHKEARVDFWVDVKGEGEATVRVSALTEEESDAKELTFPVLVHGMLKTESQVGSIATNAPKVAEQTLKFSVPAERREDQSELVLRWSPTLAGAMIDALPFLLDYPYGCTEQTMSRFVPAAITKKTLQLMGGHALKDLERMKKSINPQQLGQGDAAYKKRLAHEHKRFSRNPVYNSALMDDMIAGGLKRITKMERPGGGWGWWGGDRASVYTTAYVLWGLYEARSADVGVDSVLTNRGLAAMEGLVRHHLRHYEEHEYVSDTDAFFAYVMSLYGRQNEKLNNYLYDRRVKLSVYGKSLLALTMWQVGRKEDARVALRNAAQSLKEDQENETAWLETRTDHWWYWWHSDIESNAFFLRALSTIRKNDPRAPRIVKWLLNHRKNGWYWSSTRDSALTIAALAHYMRSVRFDQTRYTLEVLIDGKLHKTVQISAENLLSFDGELRLKGKELTTGEHEITIRRKGQGAVYFNSYLTYFTKEEDITPAGLEIRVDRKYYKLERQDRTHDLHDQRGQAVKMKEAAYRKELLKSGDQVKSGDLLLVELMLESKNDYTFLAFEDPKPAGAEPVALRSGVTYGEAVANMELRDEKVVFFLRALNQGKLLLTYRLRAEIPGTFHAMPTRGFAMYAPELRANAAEMRMKIAD